MKLARTEIWINKYRSLFLFGILITLKSAATETTIVWTELRKMTIDDTSAGCSLKCPGSFMVVALIIEVIVNQ